jgi:NTE family protein
MARSKPPRTAFVLAGGSSLGALQVGMLRALYERRIRPDLIVATSTGALNGGFLAAHPPTVETVDELAAIWRSLSRGQVFPLNPLTGLVGFAGIRKNFVSSRGIRQLISEHMTHHCMEELAIPLHVIATDVHTGEEVRLSQGPLADALVASASVPGLLPPVEIGDRVLMDGGVANNTPISHAVELGARRIYVLPTGPGCALDEPPQGALGMVIHGLNLLVQGRLATDIERFASAAELIVLPVPCPLPVHAMDFGHPDLLIDRAREEARTFLDRPVECPAIDMDAARARRRSRRRSIVGAGPPGAA